MVFSSVTFLFIFLPVVLLLYYAVPAKYRLAILFLCSLVFYAWGEPLYVLLMIFSVLINWGIGLLLGKYRSRSKAFLILSVIFNIGMLVVFKYTAFLLDTLKTIVPALSGMKTPDIRLPIGISFYTFQILSYVIDVYRGTVQPNRNVIAFGAYISMFPQLIAGPIVRYVDIEPQLKERTLSVERFSKGIGLLVIGLSKKVLLANAVGKLFSVLSAAPAANGPLGAFVALLACSFQIYFDFSGYSDMACGLGEMLGFTFMKNFEHPYASSSITDFWRRWHISLSSWFKEYVYIPLGGNRKGQRRQIINILIVWLLTGLWHGASWNFVLWGLYFGIVLILEKLFLLRALQRAPKWIGHLYACLLIMIGWGIFSFTDFSQMAGFFSALIGIGTNSIISEQALAWTVGYLPCLIVCAVASVPVMQKINDRISTRRFYKPLRNTVILLLFLLSVASLVSDSYNPFIYFRF